jgi:hypothetical protein
MEKKVIYHDALASNSISAHALLLTNAINENDVSLFFNDIEIGGETSLQEVLDNIYRMLGNTVEPFIYLKDWIVKENNSGVNLVVKEIAGWIPATTVLIPSRNWKVVPLNKPYSPTDSDDTDHLYYCNL